MILKGKLFKKINTVRHEICKNKKIEFYSILLNNALINDLLKLVTRQNNLLIKLFIDNETYTDKNCVKRFENFPCI